MWGWWWWGSGVCASGPCVHAPAVTLPYPCAGVFSSPRDPVSFPFLRTRMLFARTHSFTHVRCAHAQTLCVCARTSCGLSPLASHLSSLVSRLGTGTAARACRRRRRHGYLHLHHGRPPRGMILWGAKRALPPRHTPARCLTTTPSTKARHPPSWTSTPRRARARAEASTGAATATTGTLREARPSPRPKSKRRHGPGPPCKILTGPTWQ